MSPYLVRRGRPGTIVSLGGVEGEFLLPDQLPGQAAVHQRRQRHHADHEHAAPPRPVRRARRRRAAALGPPRRRGDLRRRAARRWPSATSGSSCTSSTPATRAGWAPTTSSGCARTGASARPSSPAPTRCSTSSASTYEQAGVDEHLHMERFQPKLGLGDGDEGEGGTIKFLKSDCEAESDGSQPILVAGEEAGLDLPYGCREGICHTCVGELRSGRVRDLRNGKVVRRGGGGDPHLHPRPRGTGRDRAVRLRDPRDQTTRRTHDHRRPERRRPERAGRRGAAPRTPCTGSRRSRSRRSAGSSTSSTSRSRPTSATATPPTSAR